MNKYIVNSKMPGFQSVDIKADELREGNCLAVIVLQGTTKDMLYDYYIAVQNIIVHRGRVVLIGVGKDCEIFFPIATMMCSYKAYDIYRVESLDIVSAPYVNRLLERKPTYEEVQAFIDGGIVSYSDLSTLIIGIESLVSENNVEGLKVFLDQHMPSLESLITTIEHFKKESELANSKELVNRIQSLKDKLKDLEDKEDELKKKNNELKEEKLKVSKELVSFQKEVERLQTENQELADAGPGAPAIKTYSEIRTSSINCKARIVIYFKEITYIPYMNSFVLSLMELLKSRKNSKGAALRVKLLIYDTNTELFQCYPKLNIVSSAEFVNGRDNYVKKVEKFVITDPNPAILTEILEYSPEYEVVIVYDRMKKTTNVVSGNNVYKFFVLNSKEDFESIKGTLGIEGNQVITRPEVNIPGAFKLGTIPNYADGTPMSRIVKYNKLKTSQNQLLIGAIFEKIRLDSIL